MLTRPSVGTPIACERLLAAAPSLRHFDRCMRNYARPANIGVAGNANSTQPYLWDIEPDLSL